MSLFFRLAPLVGYWKRFHHRPTPRLVESASEPARECCREQALPELGESLALCGVEVASLSKETLQEMEVAFQATIRTGSLTREEALRLREQLSLPALGGDSTPSSN